MGGRTSKQRDLLEGSAWLRTVVQHYQKRRQGVAGFDSFTIEPVFVPKAELTDEIDTDVVKTHERNDQVKLFRVDISFRNNKGTSQEVYWIVKASNASQQADIVNVDNSRMDAASRCVARLQHEIKVYTLLLADVAKFLDSRKNPRARFLLNIPSLVFHERAQRSGRVVRCHLVVEDVSRTKRCSPLSNYRLAHGMSLSQFKVFLGTVAQFHAVGISWNLAKKDDSALDLFPFLHREPPATPESKPRRDVLLSRFEKLLNWYFSGRKDLRELQLFSELKRMANDLLLTDLRRDLCDPFGGVCIGDVLPSEIMFQYEASFASLFDLSRDGFDSKKCHDCGGDSDDEDDFLNTDVDAKRTTVCAAVATCHRVHFGHILRELATLFYIMPEPIIRQQYLILMLQSYCHVLSITMEMLETDWMRHFKMTFHQVVLEFFQHIPQAILRAIIAHMKLTDPNELDRLVSNEKLTDDSWESERFTRRDDKQTSSDNVRSTFQRRKTIPLTPARIEFLIRLLDLIPKPV